MDKQTVSETVVLEIILLHIFLLYEMSFVLGFSEDMVSLWRSYKGGLPIVGCWQMYEFGLAFLWL